MLARVAELLDALGPFPPGSTRDKKWRTTAQLANQLGLRGVDAVTRLDQVLRQHESEGVARLDNGLPPDRVVRRAKYPDRTTALPLWGSTKHHGQPWSGHRPDRNDPAEQRRPGLVLAEDAPRVFLSHASDDALTALRLAEELAALGICAWRFETEIEQRGFIADCVRIAIAKSDALLGFVTRTSIASLWVLTELHTCLETQKVAALVVDASVVRHK
jgi:hypothetical protein